MIAQRGGWITGGGAAPDGYTLFLAVDSNLVIMNVMIWSAMRRGNAAGPIAGFGKLLASL